MPFTAFPTGIRSSTAPAAEKISTSPCAVRTKVNFPSAVTAASRGSAPTFSVPSSCHTTAAIAAGERHANKSTIMRCVNILPVLAMQSSFPGEIHPIIAKEGGSATRSPFFSSVTMHRFVSRRGPYCSRPCQPYKRDAGHPPRPASPCMKLLCSLSPGEASFLPGCAALKKSLRRGDRHKRCSI
jgi:hypothetical protein